MSLRKIALFAALILSGESAIAEVVPEYSASLHFLSAFPTDECTKAQSEQAEISLHGSFSYCLLVGSEANTEAIIDDEKTEFVFKSSKSLKGMRVGGVREEKIFENVQRKMKLILDTEAIDDTCGGGEDKCCGSYYEGTLTFVSGRQRTTFPVYYYRGG